MKSKKFFKRTSSVQILLGIIIILLIISILPERIKIVNYYKIESAINNGNRQISRMTPQFTTIDLYKNTSCSRYIDNPDFRKYYDEKLEQCNGGASMTPFECYMSVGSEDDKNSPPKQIEVPDICNVKSGEATFFYLFGKKLFKVDESFNK